MIVVVGSGPAGVAAASGLLERGVAVTMVDGGGALEPDRVALLGRMQRAQPEAWGAEELRTLRGDTRAGPSGVPVKLAWGSPFAYHDAAPGLLRLRGVDLHPSYARGGHSNVWGGALLPYRARELAGWPVGEADLAPHFAAALGLLEHRAPRDDLTASFAALPPGPLPPLEPSAQGAALLSDLERAREALRAGGVTFGGARLAVRSHDAPPCARCGLCLYGCPYDLIWTASHALPALAMRPGFTHLSGFIVERLVEGDQRVRLHLRPRDGGPPRTLEAERVLLGAGVLSSTRLALDALGLRERTLAIRCSEYFVLPLLRRRRAPGAASERLRTLAQVFVEIDSPEVDRNLVHLQVYGYNDLMASALEGMLGPARALAGLARGPLLERLLVIQGYLHQDVSSRVQATLRADGGLEVEGVQTGIGREVARRVTRKLLGLRSALGAVPMEPLLRMGRPGAGNHFGAVFPMRERPGPLESDPLGRPGGLQRIHGIDAAVFSSIAAPTITLTVMANAHRIASAAASLVSPPRATS